MNNEQQINTPSLIDSFLIFLKKETGEKEISYVNAVFHRKFAKYRHRPYPDAEKDTWKSQYMIRTWINVILHEGMTDELRLTLFPSLFDLGNSSTGVPHEARLADLTGEMGFDIGGYFFRKYPKDLQTVLTGITNTTGYDFSDRSIYYPMTSLKVVSLLHKMMKLRKSHLFSLIEPPHTSKRPTLDFRDTTPDPLNENDTLVIADLISYLSIEIPKEKLKAIHIQLLTPSKLLECIALENMEITDPIRTYYRNDTDKISLAYTKLAEDIEKFELKQPIKRQIPLDELLYTYLRTLEFQHFTGEIALITEKIKAAEKPNDITTELTKLCNEIGEELDNPISINTAIISIEDLQLFSDIHSKKLRSIIRKATGIYVRKDAIETKSSENSPDNIIDHSKKILYLFCIHKYGEVDQDKKIISVVDIISAMCTVLYQQKKNKISHSPYVIGQKTPGDNTLRYFSKGKDLKSLIETDTIPHSINQVMYRRFNHIYTHITNDEKKHDAWVDLDIATLNKYTQCLQSYDIDTIISSVYQFNKYRTSCTSKYKLPSLTDLQVDLLTKWFSHDHN
ncbi:MAG: hypothetical protein U1F12_09325 [Pseudomonadales bacterium]|jgi:hypothetical protein